MVAGLKAAALVRLLVAGLMGAAGGLMMAGLKAAALVAAAGLGSSFFSRFSCCAAWIQCVQLLR
jgi:hypothetical protein